GRGKARREENWLGAPRGTLARRSLFPLQRALLDLVDQAEDEDAEEKQDRAEDRDVVGEEFAIDERPRHEDHDLEIEEHEEQRGDEELHREARVDHALARHAALVCGVLDLVAPETLA